jgi:hypothetical protein
LLDYRLDQPVLVGGGITARSETISELRKRPISIVPEFDVVHDGRP